MAVNLGGIPWDAGANPKGLVGARGDAWEGDTSSTGEESEDWARLFLKKMNFSLEMACFGA